MYLYYRFEQRDGDLPLCSDQLGGSGGFMFMTWGGGGGGTGPGPGNPPFAVA
jgi:hypothetical protein